MPTKLYSKAGAARGIKVPATDEDKALLIRANTYPPGVKGLLRIPTDPLYTVAILFINLFTYTCIIYDFSVELRRRAYVGEFVLIDSGSLRRFIFCMDFIIFIDVLLGICHRQAKMTPARSILNITIDFIALIPYELIYVVMRGVDMRVYFGLRLRYVLKLFRYISEVRHANRFKLSMEYVMAVYIIVMSAVCLMAVCIRLQIHCLPDYTNKNSIIQCDNLTLVDIAFTYAIINGQISYSGMLFVNDSFTNINHLDNIIQIFFMITYFILISKVICIFWEKNQYKYQFCSVGNSVLKVMATSKTRSWFGYFRQTDNRKMTFLRQYLASCWKHYQVEHIKASYVGDYKAATIPAVIYAEMTLDLNWNMFKHSKLFRNEDVAFLRQLSKLTVFSFGTKNDIIYQQGNRRSIMIYIIKGIVSMMSESTGKTPLMSFSGGTVFGELSLFLNVPSATTIACSTYCEYLVLSRLEFMKIRQIYPETYQKLQTKCLKRIEYAKNYDFLAKEMYKNGEIALPKSKVSLRYIKSILRKYMVSPQPPLEQSIFIPPDMKPEASFNGTIFNTRFISLYVEANKIESDFNTHFAVAGINFKLKPSSTLYSIWRFWICVLTLVDCIFYPIGAAQDTGLYTNIYDYFVIGIRIFYILDFVTYNFISIKQDGRVIVDSELILMHHIQTLYFWLDFVSCIPIEVLVNLMQTELHPYIYRMYGINRLIKLYKVFMTIDHNIMISSVLLFVMPIVKSIYSAILLLFFGYLTFHRFGYYDRCILEVPEEEVTFWMKINIVYQFYFSMGEVGMEVDRNANLIPLIILQIAAMYVLTYIFCLNAAAYSLHKLPTITYENMVDDIKRIFELLKFPYGPRTKMNNYLKMLHGIENPTQDITYRPMMGKALYRDHTINMHYKFIDSLALFETLSKAAKHRICEVADVQFIPRGELVVIAGSVVKNIYFIMDGRCEYTLKDGTPELRPLEAKTAILLLEALVGHTAISNVIAKTDCRFLSISVSDFRRKLIKYPAEMAELKSAVINVIATQHMRHLQTIEPRANACLEENTSCRYYNLNPVQFKIAFGFFSFISMFFMKRTITPFGRFWFSWEIAHISIVFIYSFIGTIPITVSCDFRHVWFYLFRLLDVFFIIDIYLRHHVGYFNKYQIEVLHPWKCAKHYWKTGFLLEFIATLPLELIVLPLVDSIDITYLTLLRVNRHLRIFRFRGLVKFLNFRHLKTYKAVVLLTFMSISLIMCNFLLVFLYQSEPVAIQNCRPIFEENNVFVLWESYTYKLKSAIKQIFNVGIHEDSANISQLWLNVLMNALGQIVITSVSCVIIGMSLYRRTYLMTFQIKMQRLLMFMNIRKIDKNLRNEIIKHFEFQWVLREGKSLVETLKTFNRSLSDEIKYCYYAPSFHDTLLFMNYPKVLLKELFSEPSIQHEFILITGVVIRVNDVQNKIYIVYKGQVQVLGPDFGYLRDLRGGSMFGCLDNVPLHRSTLTYVAKTHCEFLSIPSDKYHEIMSKYPRFYKFYLRMLRSSNYDYIPCGKISKKRLDETPSSSAIVERKKKKAIRFVLRLLDKLTSIVPVVKEREYVKILFTVYALVAFQFQCLLLTFLSGYFRNVVYVAYALDVLFWINMYFDFSTVYENQYGLKIRSRRLIAIKYTSEFFGAPCHFLANFPIEVIVLGFPTGYRRQTWAYLRSNRLLNIVFVFRYIRSVRNRLNINVRLILILNILLILYTTQQLSIIFLSYYIGDEFFYLDALIYHSYLISKKVYTPFVISTSDLAKSVAYKLDFVLVLLATQLVCVLVVGDCVATYHMLNFSRFRYETFYNSQDKSMRLMNLSEPLIARVQLYCKNLIHHGLNVQFPSFIINAPYYLREGVLDAMFGFHLRAHPVFKLAHSDFNRQVAARFKTQYFFEGDFIAFQNDIDTKMYFVHSGEIEGLVEDNIYYDVADSRYSPGDYFGFHQLIFTNVGHTRTYKVVSKMAMVLSVKRAAVSRLLDFFPATKFLFNNKDTPNDDLKLAKVELRDYLEYTKGIHD